jgi:hypothetical protein
MDDPNARVPGNPPSVRPLAPSEPVKSAKPLKTSVSSKPQSSGKRPARRIFRWRLGAIVAISIIVLVAIVTGPAIVGLIRAGIHARSVMQSISAMKSAMESRDLDGASDALDAAAVQMEDARMALRQTGFWRDVPGVGVQIRALEDATTAGSETFVGAKTVLAVARDIFSVSEDAEAVTSELVPTIDPNVSFSELSADEKRAILAKLDASLPDLRAAQARIDVALEAWKRIPQDQLIAPLRSALASVAEQLPRLKQTIDEAMPLLEVMIPLAGYPEESRYIVLLQNDDELRPTGGFIGTVGLLDIDGGDIKTFAFSDVYSVDNLVSATWSDPAPEPIKKHLGVPVLFLRDSNWSPDFPTSAERVIDTYVREVELGTGKRPPQPTGVIAINPPFFKELLRIAGPITIDGITFDSENFFDVLEYEVEIGFLKKGIPRDQRKALLTKLGDELFATLTSLPASRWPELFDLLTTSLERKQILISSSSPQLLERLDRFGWTGRVKPTDGDYAWVVDANLAALKTDAVVDRDVTYKVDAKDPNNVTATIELRYTNRATAYAPPDDPIAYKYTRYRSYTRVYVPEGAELLSSEGAMLDDRYKTGGRVVPGTVDVTRELGKTAFGAFWSIEPKTTQTLTFTYRLPASVGERIASGSYALDWQKQSGNDATALTVEIALPKTLLKASPAEDEEDWGNASYRLVTDTTVDRRIDVEF